MDTKQRMATRDASIRRKYGEEASARPPSALRRPSTSSPLRRQTNSSSGNYTPAGSGGSGGAGGSGGSGGLGSVGLRPAQPPGTVAAMQPSAPVVLAEGVAIVEVARTMAGRRADAILLTAADGHLSGIVTDKDLAMRVVASSVDPRAPISSVMTPAPVHVARLESVDVAIDKMVRGHFRHLPVVDNDQITGLLDITKSLWHIDTTIQNAWGKAHLLQRAFLEFQLAWSNCAPPEPVKKWFDAWKDVMKEPELASILDGQSGDVPAVGLKTSVRDAARLMRERKVTAVIVKDQDGELAGIFTTKDIVLRVLAPNDLDPKTTSVVRVMTPHPDCGHDMMTVREALKKMHDGHFLHLPILAFKSKRVVGLVDVLTLTYYVLEQLAMQQKLNFSIQHSESSSSLAVNGGDDGRANVDDEAPGPMWSQFWASDANNDNFLSAGEAGSQILGSQSAISAEDQQSLCTMMAAPKSLVVKFWDPIGKCLRRCAISLPAPPSDTKTVTSRSDMDDTEWTATLDTFLNLVLLKCQLVLPTPSVPTKDDENGWTTEEIEAEEASPAPTSSPSAPPKPVLKVLPFMDMQGYVPCSLASSLPSSSTVPNLNSSLVRVRIMHMDEENDWTPLSMGRDLYDIAKHDENGVVKMKIKVECLDENGQVVFPNEYDKDLGGVKKEGKLAIGVGIVGVCVGVLGIAVGAMMRK